MMTFNQACAKISILFPTATISGTSTRCGFYVDGKLAASYNEHSGNLCFTKHGKSLQASKGARTTGYYKPLMWGY